MVPFDTKTAVAPAMILLFGVTICYYWENISHDTETMADEPRTITTLNNVIAPKINGETIRRLREEKGLTQLYVATVVGVTTDTISRWEHRRYPSIKPENAKKLAEALGVALEEILDHATPAAPPVETLELPPEQPLPPPPLPRNRRLGIGLAIFLAITILAVFLAWWFDNQKPLRVTATRILPPQAPVGLPFPVAITVTPATNEAIPLIVSETVAPECSVIASVPPFSAVNTATRTFRWITKPEGPTTLFYLAVIKPHHPLVPQLPFHGEITMRGRSGVMTPIGGADNIPVAPYHWADRNRDFKIDDEEILAVYDTFGAAGLNLEASKLEDIWSGHGYRWDATRHQLVVLP